MKILHVVRGLEQSAGTTRAVVAIAGQQARLGHEVSVYAVRKPRRIFETLPDTSLVDTRLFKMSLSPDNPGFSVGFIHAMKKNVAGFDIVHIHAVRNTVTLWAMCCAAGAGVPFVVAPHGVYDGWAMRQRPLRNKLYDRLFEVPLLDKAALIQCLTEREAQQIRAMGVRAKCAVLPNGVWSGRDRRNKGERNSVSGKSGSGTVTAGTGIHGVARPGAGARRSTGGRLLFLSRIHPKKGLDLLLPAFTGIAREFPDLQLVIAGSDAGDGYLKKTMDFARELMPGQVAGAFGSSGISGRRHSAVRMRSIPDDSRIVFLGEVAGGMKEYCYAAADAFILPSYSEGLPVAVLEAMAHELPVIITSACNLPEVEEWGAGVIARVSVDDIASKIGGVFRGEVRTRYGAAGRKLIESRFLWPSVVDRILDAYKDIVSRESRGQGANRL